MSPHRTSAPLDFRRMVDQIPILLWTSRADGSCDYLGLQWSEYTGRQASELLGSDWLSAVHPHDREGTRATWDDAVAAGVPFDLEFRLQRHDGAFRAFTTRGTPEFDAGGNVVRWYAASTDVQHLKDSDNAQHRFGTVPDAATLIRVRSERDEALERKRLATRFAGIGIWDWHVDEGPLIWNEQMYRLFDIETGTKPSYELWSSAVLAEDRPKAERAVQRAIAGESDFLVTYRVPQRDGRERVIRAVAQIRTEQSGHRRMTGICLDVTAEARTERLRELSLNTLQEFIRHAPAAIAMLDADLRYIEASQRWSEMYGLSTTSLAGRHHYDVFPEIPERWKQIHREVLAGEIRSHNEDPFLRADGRVQFIAWEAHPWHDEAGSVGGVLFFNQDVTESVRLRMRLEEQSRLLQRSNEDLQQFAYAASHDLQEPLRAIAGFAQILGRRYAGQLDPDADVIIGHMTEGAMRMRDLIDDLLTFSRVGSGETTRTVTPLGEVVASATDNLASAILESGATIEVEPLPVVVVDRSLMVQVFQNLIGNSIKYAGAAPPRVRISSVIHRDRHEIVVRDHGIGVPIDAAARVFLIFQRLHTRDEYPGTGIGLALCRRIVERHGGSIWLSRPEGPGCQIHFTLPVDASAHDES